MHHSRVVHFELPADNVERAKTFYKQAFGWDISQYPGMEYQGVVTTATDDKTRMPKEPGAINGGMTNRKDDDTSGRGHSKTPRASQEGEGFEELFRCSSRDPKREQDSEEI